MPFSFLGESPQRYCHPSVILVGGAPMKPLICVSANAMLDRNTQRTGKIKKATNKIAARGWKMGGLFLGVILKFSSLFRKEGFQWYKNEVEELKGDLEEKLGVKITNEALKKSIDLYNENRRLLREIQAFRCSDAPKLSGSEFLQISMANTSVPKEIANQELKRILEKLKNSKQLGTEKKKRIIGNGHRFSNWNNF